MSSSSSNDSAAPNPGVPVGRHVPFLDLLQVEPLETDAGRGRFRMAIDERHLRTLGILHGGVTAALLDTAMGMAAGTLAPKGHYVVTIQLNVNFIRPAWKGETLIATGEVRHSGRQTAVSFGELRTTEDALVATGTGTFMYVRHRPEDRDELHKQAEGPPATSGETPA